MTLETILAIAGPSAEQMEVKLLRAADRAAAKHIKAAAYLSPRTAAVTLKRCGSPVVEHCDWAHGSGHDSDDAANRVTAKNYAAYYFGVALGVRLAGGAR